MGFSELELPLLSIQRYGSNSSGFGYAYLSLRYQIGDEVKTVCKSEYQKLNGNVE